MRHEITPMFGKKKVILRETKRAVTPYGGLCVFVEFLSRLGWAAEARRHMPIRLTSPNAIDPVETLTAFLVAVVAGARRFAHTALLRGDRAWHALVGLRRYPGDDTIRNLFKRFGMEQVEALYGGLTRWVLERVPARKAGYSLDLDSTIFERYGRQEGARRGSNPRKPGRNSHHPLLGVLAESCTVVHSWLRSGNCGTARGVVAFLEEALALLLALLPARLTIRTVRGDAGFFEEALLGFLERRELPYIVVARMTRWLRREVEAVRQWQELDEWYAAGEFALRRLGWPATLRSRVSVAGGILGRTGQRTVLFLSQSWGGLQQRIALFHKMLNYDFPTSPKLVPEPST